MRCLAARDSVLEYLASRNIVNRGGTDARNKVVLDRLQCISIALVKAEEDSLAADPGAGERLQRLDQGRMPHLAVTQRAALGCEQLLRPRYALTHHRRRKTYSLRYRAADSLPEDLIASLFSDR